jgi:hypothetical protein
MINLIATRDVAPAYCAPTILPFKPVCDIFFGMGTLRSRSLCPGFTAPSGIFIKIIAPVFTGSGQHVIPILKINLDALIQLMFFVFIVPRTSNPPIAFTTITAKYITNIDMPILAWLAGEICL